MVAGDVQGNVEASDKITIHKNGSLIGDIKTAGIVIDDGAYFKGNIDIVKSPPINVKKPEAVKAARKLPEPIQKRPELFVRLQRMHALEDGLADGVFGMHHCLRFGNHFWLLPAG